MKIKTQRNATHPHSIREILESAAAEEPRHIAYMDKDMTAEDGIRRITNAELYKDVENCGAALTACGYGKAHIAIIAENSYSWIVTYLTALMTEGVFVPIDKELPYTDLKNLLLDSDAEVLFCDEAHEKLLREHRGEFPAVSLIVVIGKDESDGIFKSFSEFLKEGDAAGSRGKAGFHALSRDEYALAEIVYTSGTTGVSKGVMLSEHNLCSVVYYGMQVSGITERGMSVLPYHHTYEAVCDILVAIHSRSTLCLNHSLRHVKEDMQLYKPSYIYLVPAFAEHFYKLIWNNARKAGKEKSFRRALRLSAFLRKVGIDLRPVLFRKVRSAFGGRLRKIVCGGAPIRPEIGKFFDEIGISMIGGYGITECAPLVSLNDDKGNNFASAGRILSCLRVKIENKDANGIGEICIAGDNVMMGYYKRPDLTKEAVIDGWFHTGDFGYLNKKNEVVITGRKKNIIVLHNGKNVYPEELEMKIGDIVGITEAVVCGIKNEYGESVGLMAEIYSEEGLSSDTLLKEIHERLRDEPSFKQITRVVTRNEPFRKTTTNKIRRDA